MNVSRRRLISYAAASVTVPAFAEPPAMRVALQLNAGVIVIDLHMKQAPLSAADFLRYVDGGLYDGGAFTRTVRGDNDHGTPRIEVVQGGIRPGATTFPPIALETTRATGLHHLDGTISLPRDKPGTGSGAEFFICIGPQPSLDFGGQRNADGQGFAAFGQVIAGMDLVRTIWKMPATGPSPDPYTAGQMLSPPLGIASARRLGPS